MRIFSRTRIQFILAATVITLPSIGIYVERRSERSTVAVPVQSFASLANTLGVTIEAFGPGKPIFTGSGSAGWLAISGTSSLSAGTADDWFFVRQSVTWANANSTLADNIITSLKKAGLLRNSGTVTNTNLPIDGIVYKVRLETGGCASCNLVGSTAYTGTKSFANRFKMWRASDNLEVLEMLFDNVDSAATGNGILLNYRLAVLSPANSDNENLIVETYMSSASPSRKQTYSWGAPFWTSGARAATACDAGRVVLEEMSFNLVSGSVVSGIGVRAAVRTVPQTIPACNGSSVPYYYTVSYMQKTNGDFETTALEGVEDNALPASATLCGFPGFGFGIFNGGGFIQDGLTLLNVPAGYPDPGNGAYGVQQEFDKIGTAGSGAGGYDDLLKATIDGLNPAFHSANDPP